VFRGNLRRSLLIAAFATGAVAVIALPVAAVIARLTSLPLGKGHATIEWTGESGASPSVTSLSGQIGAYSVSGHDQVLTPQETHPAPGGNTSTSATIPSSFPFGLVKGTIGGTTFTLHITLEIPTSLTQGRFTLATVTGSLRGQSIQATLTAITSTQNLDFQGTIGTYHVTGVIRPPQHHGNRSVAQASYDVTK
jgi:hypothetical protein